MVSTKWTYHKKWSLPVTTLFIWRFCFSLRTSYEELIDIPTTQMYKFLLFVSAGVLLDGTFSLSVSSSTIEGKGRIMENSYTMFQIINGICGFSINPNFILFKWRLKKNIRQRNVSFTRLKFAELEICF